jgi:hypothetical protein
MIDNGETVSGVRLPEPDEVTESWGEYLLKVTLLSPFVLIPVYALFY